MLEASFPSFPFFCQLFVHDFLAAWGLVFSWLPRLHKAEGDVQCAMLERHLCYSQAILWIFNGGINIFRSGIYECNHWPVRSTFILPLTIVNIPPFTITLLPSGKIDVLLKIIRMSSFDEDNTVQTLHRYLNPQTGYVDEPEHYPTANICGQSVSLRFSKYRPPHCYLLSEMCLRRIVKKRVDSRIPFLLVSLLHTSNLSSSISNWFLNIWDRLVVSSIGRYHLRIWILDLINVYIRWRDLDQVRRSNYQSHEAYSSSSDTSSTNEDVSPCSISFEMQVATSVDRLARSRVVSW